jgi:hypothetical protein
MNLMLLQWVCIMKLRLSQWAEFMKLRLFHLVGFLKVMLSYCCELGLKFHLLHLGGLRFLNVRLA